MLRQARKNGLPLIAFVNKMDRQGADGWRSLRKLATEIVGMQRNVIVPLQVYAQDDCGSVGIVDVARMELLRFSSDDEGKTVHRERFFPEGETSLHAQVRMVRQYIGRNVSSLLFVFDYYLRCNNIITILFKWTRSLIWMTPFSIPSSNTKTHFIPNSYSTSTWLCVDSQ